MKIFKPVLSILLSLGAGCASLSPAPVISLSDLPNCFDTNYDKEHGLFTIKNDVGNSVNQQCLLTVGPNGDAAPASRLRAGRYSVYLSNGGGGGAGGTIQTFQSEGEGGGGGGGGGGAGAMEIRATVDLTEGQYKLTIGAGGPGGSICIPGAGFGGGPGWLGSPSNMVRIATGELIVGTPGADSYVRPSRSQNEKMAGRMDGRGGSGPGQTSGGHGGRPESRYHVVNEADPGASKFASGRSGVGGAPGIDASVNDKRAGEGGGGGATSIGQGGKGGGGGQRHLDIDPERGSLGSGGGGGKGNSFECDAGASGGHGYIALRPI